MRDFFIWSCPHWLVGFFVFYINIHLYTRIWLEVNIVYRWRKLNKFSSKTFLSKPFVQYLQQQWYLTSCIYINMKWTVDILVTINLLNLFRLKCFSVWRSLTTKLNPFLGYPSNKFKSVLRLPTTKFHSICGSLTTAHSTNPPSRAGAH